MKRFRIYFGITLGALIVIVSTLALLYVRTAGRGTPHFWWRVDAKTEYNKKSLERTDVYRGSGLLLVDLTEQENAIYVIDLKSHEINVLHNYYRSAVTPPSPLKPLAATEAVVEPWRVEFTTPEGRRIRVQWTAHL